MKLCAWVALVLVAAALAISTLGAFAAEAVLDADEKLQCRLGGGCLFITQDALIGHLRAARESGKREANAECRRPMT